MLQLSLLSNSWNKAKLLQSGHGAEQKGSLQDHTVSPLAGHHTLPFWTHRSLPGVTKHVVAETCAARRD